MKKSFLLLLWLTLLPMVGWAQDATLQIGGSHTSTQNALEVTYKGDPLSVTVTGGSGSGQYTWQYNQTGTGWMWQNAQANNIRNVGYYRVRRGNNNTYAYLRITPASLTVTANSVSKVYGTTDASVAGFTVSGQVGSDNANSATVSNPTRSRVEQGENVGSYLYTYSGGTVSGQQANNYTIGSYVQGSITITAKELTLTGKTVEKTYGDTDESVVGYTVTGMANNEAAPIINATYSRTDASEDVGVYSYTYTNASSANANYTVGTINPGQLTINAKALTLTAGAASKTYGQADADATFTYSVAGMVNNEAAPDVTGLSIAARANAGETAGEQAGTYSYDLTGGVSANANYTIGTYLPGTLTMV